MNELIPPLKAALYRIASTSPSHERNTIYREQEGGGVLRRSAHLSSEWKTREHEFLWAIYSRAVFDYFGIGLSGGKFVCADIPAKDMARYGFIEMPDGSKRNLLELLSIDPDWAWSQLKKAINHTQKMAA